MSIKHLNVFMNGFGVRGNRGAGGQPGLPVDLGNLSTDALAQTFCIVPLLIAFNENTFT